MSMDLTPKNLYVGSKPIAVKGLLPSQTQVKVAMEYLVAQGIIKTGRGTDYIQCFEEIVVVGDSTSCGFTEMPGRGVASAEAKERGANWPTYMGLDIGRDITNLAVGGSTVRDWRNTHITTAEGVSADCYIVLMGINDALQNLPIGTSADISADYTTNADTFYGNLDFLVRKLLSFNPGAKLFICTNGHSFTNQAATNEVIRYIGNRTPGVYLIDLATIYAAEFIDGFMAATQQGVHFSTLGYRRLATMIRDSINDYMERNPGAFVGVPYISDPAE